jgi:4-hydroxy-tetrahydrodipicolinate synthase
MDTVKKFGRVIIPMCTAFNEDYTIDYQLTNKVARHLIEKSLCDSLIIAGTNGEFYTMSFEEKVNLFSSVKKEVGNEMPLIAGTGSSNTKETIELTQKAEGLGYDAVMVVVPYYCHPTQEGLYQHFARIAENTNLPIFIYNIPLLTGTNIEPATVLQLTEYKNIVGLKDEAGVNPLQASEILRLTEGKIEVYSGDDLMVLAIMTQGGSGVVSGGSHVIGDMMRDMINSYLEGEMQETTEKFKRLYNLFIAFFGRNKRLKNPLPAVKAAFEISSGLPVSRVRPPLMEPEEDEIKTLKESLRIVGKL